MKKFIRFLLIILVILMLGEKTGLLSSLPFLPASSSSRAEHVRPSSESETSDSSSGDSGSSDSSSGNSGASDSASGDSGTSDSASGSDIGSVFSGLQDFFAEDSAPDVSDFPDHYCYYYNQLSEEEQQVYLEIYACLRDRSKEQMLSTTDEDVMFHVFSLVQLDHPEFIWVSGCQYVLASGYDGKVRSITLEPEYSMTGKEISAAETAIDDYRSSFLSWLKENYDSSDDWEKALAAFRWVAAHTEYQTDAPHNQDMYSAVLGNTVCQGYAMAFQDLCNQIDVPCLVVTGTSEKGASHAWNMVQLNGSWCHVDCTYADSPILDFDIDYSWFGVNASLINAQRTCDESSLLPAAATAPASYFSKRGCYLNSYDRTQVRQLASKYNPIGITFSGQTAYQEACEDLFDRKNVQNIGKGSSFSYVTEDLSLTIFIQVSN